ncbi:MAG TPA: transcriptional regulator [Janthinobacterium sp.]|nr:transcriptional regulator [Janthinobacterium sp.]
MTKETRSYNQYCPLARTLDVLGERWTLLIVRELLSGPKRFKDLQDALVGIGTNLLSARLKEIERNGLVARAKLPPPGVASVYELTEHGRKLDETLLSLIRWGIPLLAEPKRPTDYFMPHWMLHGMLSTFKPSLAHGLVETYEFHVDNEVFHTHVRDGHASGDMGKGHHPCLVWESDSESFMALVFNLMTPQQAHERGYIKTGTVEMVQRVLRIFDPMTMLADENTGE